MAFTIAKTSTSRSDVAAVGSPRTATTMSATVTASAGKRNREARERHDDRGIDPRDVFVRELVHDRDRDYSLNGSESRTLAVVGACRVVSERDLRIRARAPVISDTSRTRHSSSACP